jgi:hypothetical protein
MNVRLLTLEEAADFLCVTKRYLWDLIQSGFPARKVSINAIRNTYRISFADLFAWVNFKKEYSELSTTERLEVDKSAAFYWCLDKELGNE